MKQKMKIPYTVLCYMLLIFVSAIILFPLIFLFTNSFMSASDLNVYYGIAEKKFFHWVPDNFTLDQYVHAFLYSYQFLHSFWISILTTVPSVIFQLILSLMAGYGFAKHNFPFKNALFILYVILMMTPFQVIQAPQYILFNDIGLLDNIASIVLTSIFYPLGICIMTQSMKKIPDELIEASKIDGANSVQTLIHIVVPSAKNGIVTVLFLSFIEQWTIVEQAVVFIKSTANMPLAVMMQRLSGLSTPGSFVFALLFIIPPILICFICDEYILDGIIKAELLEV